MGPRGFTGEMGPIGRGFTGEMGPRGFTGEMGPRGFTGEKGKDLVLNNDITVSSIRIGNTNYSINQNGLFSASSLNISSATGISGYIGIDDSLIYKNDLTNLKNLTAGKYLLTDVTSTTLNVGGPLLNEKTRINNSGYLTAPKIFTSDFDTGIDQDGVRSKKLIIKDPLGTPTTTIDNNGVFSTKNITGFNFTGQNIDGRNGFFSEKINSSNLSIGYNGPNGQENFVVDSRGNITKVNDIKCSSGSSISGNIIYSKSVYSDSINVINKQGTGYNTYIDNTTGVRTDRLRVGNTIIDAIDGITFRDRVNLNNINANNASFYNLDITDVDGNRVGGIDRLGDLSVRTLTLGNQQNININGLDGSIQANGFITAGNLQSNNNLFVRNGYIDTSVIQIRKDSPGEYTYITDKGINTNSLNIIGTTTNFDSTGRLSLNRADVSSLIKVGGGNTTVDISPTGGISCNNVRISTNSSLNGRSLTINENYSSIDQNGNINATSLTLRPMSDNFTTTPTKLTIGGLTIEPDGTTGGIIKGATFTDIKLSNSLTSTGTISGGTITGSVIQGAGGSSIDSSGELRLGTNKRMCLDGLCLTKNQLRTLLINSKLLTFGDYSLNNWTLFRTNQTSNLNYSWFCPIIDPLATSLTNPIFLVFKTPFSGGSIKTEVKLTEYIDPFLIEKPSPNLLYLNFVSVGTQAQLFNINGTTNTSTVTSSESFDIITKVIQLKKKLGFIFLTCRGYYFWVDNSFASYCCGTSPSFTISTNTVRPLNGIDLTHGLINGAYPSINQFSYISQLIDANGNHTGFLGKKFNSNNNTHDWYVSTDIWSITTNFAPPTAIGWTFINIHPIANGKRLATFYYIIQLNDYTFIAVDLNYDVWYTSLTTINPVINMSGVWIKTSNKIPPQLMSTGFYSFNYGGHNPTLTAFPTTIKKSLSGTPEPLIIEQMINNPINNTNNYFSPGMLQLPNGNIISWGSSNNNNGSLNDPVWMTTPV